MTSDQEARDIIEAAKRGDLDAIHEVLNAVLGNNDDDGCQQHGTDIHEGDERREEGF